MLAPVTTGRRCRRESTDADGPRCRRFVRYGAAQLALLAATQHRTVLFAVGRRFLAAAMFAASTPIRFLFFGRQLAYPAGAGLSNHAASFLPRACARDDASGRRTACCLACRHPKYRPAIVGRASARAAHCRRWLRDLADGSSASARVSPPAVSARSVPPPSAFFRSAALLRRQPPELCR